MTHHEFQTGVGCARALDADDELARFRSAFELPKHGAQPATYLCGHSLGLMPSAARRRVDAELERWARRGVEGHFEGDGWLRYHERFAAPLARLVGAAPGEVVAMNSLTVNLHLMLVSFYRPTPDRHKIVVERDAFPSDRFAVESQLRFHGFDPRDSLLELAPEPGQWTLDLARLQALLDEHSEQIALLLLPGVQYLSGQALDIGSAVSLAHRHGCVIGFDLAHAVGNLPLGLHEAGADFAVWCSYKYLNAGPGAVGGAFVHRDALERGGLPRFEGWWGQEEARRFDAAAAFSPLPGAAAWQLSNPPILSLAPLDASLALFDEAGIERLRAKSERLTAYLEFLLRKEIGEAAEILTPSEPAARGCQLSIKLAAGGKRNDVAAGLRKAGVVADWRKSGILRLAPVPLYNRFRDAFDAVQALKRALR